MKDEELFALYLEAHGGLICPFPVLETMRKHPELIWDYNLYADLVKKEADYYRRKRMAQDKLESHIANRKAQERAEEEE